MQKRFLFNQKDVPLQNYFDKMNSLLRMLLDFIDQDRVEENYQNLMIFIKDQKICEDSHLLKSLLRILSKLIDNHKRSPTFFEMIEKILLFLKGDIKKNFSNLEIFNIFITNKRILLFLIKEEFIFLNQKIYSKINNNIQLKKYNYFEYFIRELKIYFDKDMLNQVPEIPPNFDDLRQIGENDNTICKLIRNDDIEKFVEYVNRKSIDLNSLVDESIYETNIFLMDNRPRLIEYAAFFGSIEIFNYMISQKVLLTDIWPYAVHGRRKRIINYLESVNKRPSDESVLIESIKCHHNEITDYLNQQILGSNNKKTLAFLLYGLEFYDFSLINCDLIDASIFPHACKFDHYYIAQYLLQTKNVDVNALEILKKNYFFMNIFLTFFLVYKTPLMLAIREENVDIVKLLLSCPLVNPNIRYKIFINYFFK